MRNITKIFTLVLSLILLFAVSCSNDDKTGVANNPPENDTEITGGGTETTEGYFPPPEGKYRYDTRALKSKGSSFEPTVSYIAGEKTKIEGSLVLHGSNEEEEDGKYLLGFLELTVSKWKKTTKNGEITKTEAVDFEIGGKIHIAGRYETVTFSEVIYDYETKILSITCKVTKDGSKKTLSTKSEKY